MHFNLFSSLWIALKAGTGITLTRKAGQIVIAASGGASALEIKEQDGSPDVSGVTLIKVSNGTLTDDGGGAVSITTGGGGSSLEVKEEDGTPDVASVSTIIVPNGTLTDSGAGVIHLAWAPVDGWVPVSDTWTYSSADGPTGVFTITGDFTSILTPGVRLKLTQTTVKYFIVTKVSVAAGTTTVTCYGGTDYTLANAAISVNYYSRVKAPLGFPATPAKWTEATTDSSERNQNSPTQNTWYQPGSLTIVLPIGSWFVSYDAIIDHAHASASLMTITLSTSTSSESDTELSSRQQGTTRMAASVFKRKLIDVTSKTTYNLIIRSTQSSMSFIDIRGDVAPITMRAVCAYL